MKTIEESVLLDYSKEQLMEVIDSATSYDISTVLYTFGICYVDGIKLNDERIQSLDSRVSDLGFDSFNSYIQDLLDNSDASDVGELLSLEPAEPKDVTYDGPLFGEEVSDISNLVSRLLYITIERVFSLFWSDDRVK